MKNPETRRLARTLGTLAGIGALAGCIVLPFGHDGGDEHGDRGRRDSHEHYLPAPVSLPACNADDALACAEFTAAGQVHASAAPRLYQSAVYVPPAVSAKDRGLWA